MAVIGSDGGGGGGQLHGLATAATIFVEPRQGSCSHESWQVPVAFHVTLT